MHLFSNGTTEALTVLSNGNVGLGTTTPFAKLQVNGLLLSGNQTSANLDSRNININFLANTGQLLMGWNRSASEGETDFISNRGTGGIGGFAFYDYANSGTTPQTQLMRMRSTGEVLIGVTDFTKNIGINKLAVGGGIITDVVTVKLQSAWPDNIFKPNYKLMPLNEVKAFVDQNHHLPEIPSEIEVQKNGQNLGEMNRLLLKKVEELTLYMIEEKNLLEKQAKALHEQQQENKLLQKRMSTIERKQSNKRSKK